VFPDALQKMGFALAGQRKGFKSAKFVGRREQRELLARSSPDRARKLAARRWLVLVAAAAAVASRSMVGRG